MNTYSLEPELHAFEELLGCKLCLHIYSDSFFCGGNILIDRRRSSHRKTHPERCGREQRSYCIRHCKADLERRMAASPEKDIFAVHCRNGCFELVTPVYRNGRRMLTVFAGLLDPREKSHVRSIAKLLPVFAAGLEAKAHEKALINSNNTESCQEKVMEFIENHYFEDISTADAAKAVSLSVSRLCHILKENSLGTFSQLLTAERIYHAKQFLAYSDSELRLNEISMLCGFGKYEHFSRTFKKETGFSPAEWRKKHCDH